MSSQIDEALIKKQILHPGRKFVNFTNGTRVRFHYMTRKLDGTQQILDDSRKIDKPMELVLGKKFKLEVWEVIVQKMAVSEVAKFTVHKSLVPHYPFIAKTLRDVRKPHTERKHCCGMTLQNEGMGYKDLDNLFANPCDLEFTIELLEVELPEQYEKESWQLTDDEKTGAIETLRERGNQYYKERNYSAAEESYRNALGMLEQLMLKEKPNDDEWNDLLKIKIPFLLNFAQCKLLAKDYYAVIEHCTEVLKYDPDNVKALYRRAKANVGAWNPTDAQNDYQRCAALDVTLMPQVTKELATLAEEIKVHNLEDKLKYQKIF